MEEKKEKISFFERIKIAVFKLEDYSKFLNEKTYVAIKYFFLISFIFSIVLAILGTYDIEKIINKGISYIENELPEFTYADGKLNFDEYVEAYDNDYEIYMIADTSDIDGDQVQMLENKIKTVGIIFLKEKMIYVTPNGGIEYKYEDISKQYEIPDFSREILIQKLDEASPKGIIASLFVLMLVFEFLIEIVAIMLDWFVIAIFAWVVSKIVKVDLKFKQTFNIAIYALTLSLILSIVYNVANYLTGFYTEYFRSVYLLISYVYVVAVILMMKTDGVGQNVEVKVDEEIKTIENNEVVDEKEKEKKEEPKEKDDEKTEEDSNVDTDNEPEGSEI